MAITLTELAASEVKRVIDENPPESSAEQLYLRLRISGGGCQGLNSKLDVDSTYDPAKDELFEQHGIKIVVDKRSLLYANGATIDYHNDLNVRGFKVSIPGSTSCGCGSSFSIN